MRRLIFGLLLLAATAANAGSAFLTWTPPTQNTDGSVLTDLVQYRVRWGCAQSGVYSDSLVIPAPASTYNLTGLPDTGTCYFVVHAINATGAESVASNQASKFFGSPPVITPNPPTNLRFADIPEPDPEPMAITLDATLATVTNNTATITISNFTATAGSAILVHVGIEDDTDTVTDVSYNGQSLTELSDVELASSGVTARIAVYMGLAGADGSPHDVVVTLSGTAASVVMARASSWLGVESSSVAAAHRTIYEAGDNNDGLGIDVTVVDSQSGDVVVSADYTASASITNDFTNVGINNNMQGNGKSYGVQYTTASGASTVMTWTSDNFCTHVAFALVPSGAPAATPQARLIRGSNRFN